MIRFANENDAASILKIYAPYISTSAITFDCEVPGAYEMRRKILTVTNQFPWLVCEINGTVAGYAFASSLFSKSAYRWSADLSVYICDTWQRCNIASALYFALLEILKIQGYCNVTARITVPNEKSEIFHTSFGFTKAGVLKKCGYKLGKWHDVAIYEKSLNENGEAPNEIIPIKEVDEVLTGIIFKKAEKIIRIPN